MDLKRRTSLIYGLLLAVWLVIVFWQFQEHARVKEAAKAELRDNSGVVANFLSAVIRGMRFRGAVLQDNLKRPFENLIRTNDFNKARELISIALLNTSGDPLFFVGDAIGTNDLAHLQVSQDGELWGQNTFIVIKPVAGVEETNSTVVIPPRSDFTNNISTSQRDGRSRDGDGRSRNRRPPWMRDMDDEEFEALISRRELHGLVLAMSTEKMRAKSLHDLWLRGVIVFFAGISVLGVGMAWGNVSKSSELQIRLVRASELNTHLKAMNLAAAGLAHETRNPLNIIRGMAQMLSKQPDAPVEIRDKTRAIMDETDKVTAQLTEFINYSRPREVRRTSLSLNTLVAELVRTLDFDLEEKAIKLEVGGEQCSIEADDQLLRQALFNLLINAVQSVGQNGNIQVVIRRRNSAEAFIEIIDDGPGVPPENREEIFKPYFTTQPKGTGLGLAVVQQIVLAHGWEIECLPNEPKGAIFRISHFKLT